MNREALTENKDQLINAGEYDTSNEETNGYQVCVEALEKQIPKKINNADGFGGRCPVCGYYIAKIIYSSKGYKYCPECGQKLDWEVKE